MPAYSTGHVMPNGYIWRSSRIHIRLLEARWHNLRVLMHTAMPRTTIIPVSYFDVFKHDLERRIQQWICRRHPIPAYVNRWSIWPMTSSIITTALDIGWKLCPFFISDLWIALLDMSQLGYHMITSRVYKVAILGFVSFRVCSGPQQTWAFFRHNIPKFRQHIWS